MGDGTKEKWKTLILALIISILIVAIPISITIHSAIKQNEVLSEIKSELPSDITLLEPSYPPGLVWIVPLCYIGFICFLTIFFYMVIERVKKRRKK